MSQFVYALRSARVTMLKRGDVVVFTGDSVYWGLRSMTPFKVIRTWKTGGKVCEIQFENLRTGRRFQVSAQESLQYFGKKAA